MRVAGPDKSEPGVVVIDPHTAKHTNNERLIQRVNLYLAVGGIYSMSILFTLILF
jgi:hypothetical protein